MAGGVSVDLGPGGQIWSAAVGGGGVGLRSPPSGFGWAGLLQCVRACGSASTGGGEFAWPAFGGQGIGPGVSRMCLAGLCGSMGGPGVPWGVRLFAVGVGGLLVVEGGEGLSLGVSVAGVCG